MKLVIAIMVLIMTHFVSVSADNGTIARYDDSKDRVVLSGSAVDKAQEGLVSLSVYYDKDSSETYTDGDVFRYMTTIRKEDIKDNCYSFKLVNVTDKTQEVESGDYIARIKSEGASVEEVPFFYVSESERIIRLNNINSATSVSALDAIITANMELFDIDVNKYNSLDKTYVLSAVANKKPQGGFSSLKAFADVLKETMGCYALKTASDADDVKSAIEKYNEYFKIETAVMYGEFTALSESAKNEVYKKLKGRAYNDGKDFRNEFDSAVALCLVNDAKQWSEIKKVLENYAENLLKDLTYLNKCNKADLSVELSKAIPFDTKEELYDAIKSYAENQSTSGGGGSSGGGGGGSSSGGGGGSSSGGNSKYSHSEEFEISDEETVNTVTKNDELKDYEWARNAVEGLMATGAVKGNENGLFMPGNQITREEFLKILVEAFGLYESGKECDFSDVSKSNWAYSYIACAVDKGVVNGIGENRFGLGQQITRQDMAVMIERATKIAGITLEEKNAKNFVDANSISDYARGSVEKLAKSGVINGYDDGSFKPLNFVIRAEAAVMIYNVVKGE